MGLCAPNNDLYTYDEEEGGIALMILTSVRTLRPCCPCSNLAGSTLRLLHTFNLATYAARRRAVHALALLGTLPSRIARSDLAAHATASPKTLQAHCTRSGLASHALRNH